MEHAEGHHDPLHPSHLFGHVQDSEYIEVPRFMAPETNGRISIPQFFTGEANEVTENIGGRPFTLTKFMLIELVVAIIMIVIFTRLAAKMRRSDVPKGRWWNSLEGMLVYIRDEVAHAAIGHDAHRFLPFLWTVFFFVLICNLFGCCRGWVPRPRPLSVTGRLPHNIHGSARHRHGENSA